MDISSKYRQVKGWLDNLYSGKPVPAFEHNEQTICLLYELMEKNIARDHDTQLIIQDLRQKASEYSAEGHRLIGILATISLKTGTLSQSGVMSLHTLTKLMWLLQIKDATDTSFLLALQALQDEADSIHEELLAEEHTLTQLTNKTKDALVTHNRVVMTYKDLEKQSIQKEARLEKQAKDNTFLYKKSQEYGRHISKLTETLKQNKVDASIFHENLVKKSQELQKIEEELEPLKKKLQDYNCLPADLSEAKLKLANLRNQVQQCEMQLNSKIDLMKL